MKKLLLIISCFSLANSFAYDYDQSYLKVGPGFYEEVFGNGHEAGFEFTVVVQGTQKKGQEIKYHKPTIKITNDSADCSFGTHMGAPIKKELSYTGQISGTKYYKFTFKGEVNTSVNGDTGGCVATIFVKNENFMGSEEELLKVIRYGYVTDY